MIFAWALLSNNKSYVVEWVAEMIINYFLGVDLEGENHGLVEYTIQAFLFGEWGNPHTTSVKRGSIEVRGCIQSASLERCRYTSLLDVHV